ncbi:hypothetical protein SBA4_4050005 [Candidatus Sulfopaludibacter sp. SbA4]|nr:hypothetical protein SBA4_4050005 [Candidatus Sulfopaludibacter sp. SbA4]
MKKNVLKCPECDRRNLQASVTELTGSTHGESFSIRSDALVCPNCGFKTMPVERMGEFALRVADAYREKHDLLTSGQIRERRLDLGMSQQQFANYLGVGSSSIKRWELGQIQDRAMNTLMVLKTDIKAAQDNVAEVASRLGQPVFASGEWRRWMDRLFQSRPALPSTPLSSLQDELASGYNALYKGGMVA